MAFRVIKHPYPAIRLSWISITNGPIYHKDLPNEIFRIVNRVNGKAIILIHTSTGENTNLRRLRLHRRRHFIGRSYLQQKQQQQ